jgi:hypothetical protein
VISKQPIDWGRVEHDYRAGLLSVREIGTAHHVSHTAINKRARLEGWERNLTAKIWARADALVSKRAVSREVSTAERKSEREIIENNAEAIVSVRMAHRRDIRRSRQLANKMLEELEQLTDHRELAESFGEFMRAQEGSGGDRQNDLYSKIIALPSRTKLMREMAETLKVLITLERQAYNLDEQRDEETYEVRLRRLLAPG